MDEHGAENADEIGMNEYEEEGERDFDPCPKIPVSKDEFKDWCKPWKQAHVVKLLGLNLSFRTMET